MRAAALDGDSKPEVPGVLGRGMDDDGVFGRGMPLVCRGSDDVDDAADGVGVLARSGRLPVDAAAGSDDPGVLARGRPDPMDDAGDMAELVLMERERGPDGAAAFDEGDVSADAVRLCRMPDPGAEPEAEGRGEPARYGLFGRIRPGDL